MAKNLKISHHHNPKQMPNIAIGEAQAKQPVV